MDETYDAWCSKCGYGPSTKHGVKVHNAKTHEGDAEYEYDDPNINEDVQKYIERYNSPGGGITHLKYAVAEYLKNNKEPGQAIKSKFIARDIGPSAKAIGQAMYGIEESRVNGVTVTRITGSKPFTWRVEYSDEE